MLQKFVSKGGKDWDKQLGPVLFAYCTTPHSSSGEISFYQVYGGDANFPSALILPHNELDILFWKLNLLES